MSSSYKNYCFIILTVFLLVSAIHLPTAKAADYYLLEDFYKFNPDEISKTTDFNELIKKDSPPPLNKNLTVSIAMVYPGKQVSDYWNRSSKSFRLRLKQYGITPQIHSFFLKPTATFREQNAVFKEALATDPDYLIFTIDTLRHQRMIEPLLIKNKPKIILQNITTPLKAWTDKQPMMYIGFDHVNGSKMLAEYFAEKTYGNGRYAILLPDPGYLSEVRGETFVSYMDNNTNLELVSVYQTGINKEKARLATLAIIEKNPDIKFIYACSTDIALGAIEALRKKNMIGKIMVNGWGGGSSELKAIQKGEMDVTVMRINDDNGVAMADAVILDMLGESKKLPLVFSGRLELIEKGINPQKLDLLKNKSFRYSGRAED
ncbi:monosaccharide ABC transporter substrate-binding protein, CUT2 family (TC 3.A.1.2.-) [Maridesulfovibrio ferrireducens]|uniref:Monosaccharide ABC transporter substrate-binding protein, CUT2 family (TC 3.A.1.2.-) n=1 Tax=Maridesulfovibrio ferrireducens TaxID=246191 RepID=A0A1G9KP01_9BACT|nr:substrate-binding domain-containing protein [Maridesulfovibrio ferrireducens]SDL51254.1 monosaccharide ABC transporter substrate-binding protein, CUT2 family (TC 3.A.1.2.-) [Maridesulfovibrio ferrireducens]